MELTLTFSGADAAAITAYADENKLTPFDFARDAIMQIINRGDNEKARRNTEYLAKLDRSFKQFNSLKKEKSFRSPKKSGKIY